MTTAELAIKQLRVVAETQHRAAGFYEASFDHMAVDRAGRIAARCERLAARLELAPPADEAA